MDNQLSVSITEQIADIKNTQKGNEYIKSDGEISTLVDSKDVTKRKKELRTAININCWTAIKYTNNDLNNAIKSDKKIQLTAKDTKNLIGNMSLGIANFVEGITGSSWIKEIVYNYTYFYIGNFLIDYLNSPQKEDSK